MISIDVEILGKTDDGEVIFPKMSYKGAKKLAKFIDRVARKPTFSTLG